MYSKLFGKVWIARNTGTLVVFWIYMYSNLFGKVWIEGIMVEVTLVDITQEYILYTFSSLCLGDFQYFSCVLVIVAVVIKSIFISGSDVDSLA